MLTFENAKIIYILNGDRLRKEAVKLCRVSTQNPVQHLELSTELITYTVKRGASVGYCESNGEIIGTSKEILKASVCDDIRNAEEKIKHYREQLAESKRRLSSLTGDYQNSPRNGHGRERGNRNSPRN